MGYKGYAPWEGAYDWEDEAYREAESEAGKAANEALIAQYDAENALLEPDYDEPLPSTVPGPRTELLGGNRQHPSGKQGQGSGDDGI